MPPTDTLLLAHEEALEALLAALRLAKEQGDLRELRLAAKAILSLRPPRAPGPAPGPGPGPSSPSSPPAPAEPRPGPAEADRPRPSPPPLPPAARAAAAAGLPALSQLLTLTDSPGLMAQLLAGEDAESLLGLRQEMARGP